MLTAARMIEALEGTGDGLDAEAHEAGELLLGWLLSEWLPLDLLCARMREREIVIEPAELERVLLERGAAHRWIEDEGTGNLTAEYRFVA